MLLLLLVLSLLTEVFHSVDMMDAVVSRARQPHAYHCFDFSANYYIVQYNKDIEEVQKE